MPLVPVFVFHFTSLTFQDDATTNSEMISYFTSKFFVPQQLRYFEHFHKPFSKKLRLFTAYLYAAVWRRSSAFFCAVARSASSWKYQKFSESCWVCRFQFINHWWGVTQQLKTYLYIMDPHSSLSSQSLWKPWGPKYLHRYISWKIWALKRV